MRGWEAGRMNGGVPFVLEAEQTLQSELLHSSQAVVSDRGMLGPMVLLRNALFR